jgi:CHAD domain-containing protein
MTVEEKAPTVVSERERKFDLDAGRPVPRLAGVGPVAAQCEPVESQLRAAYFDTDDKRLLRAGITLRRRTGGGDAGWHLKLPGEAGARDEIQLPLDSGERRVPEELADRVRRWSGGRDLVEIARLRTDRVSYDLTDAAGNRLAVLTDDRVAGERAGKAVRLDGWRELEVELEPTADSALLDVLSEALIEAGVRPAHWPSKLRRLLADSVPDETRLGRRSTAGEVVVAYLRVQVEALRRHDFAVRRDEQDAVHQLRVAMRRLRTALKAYRNVLDRDATSAVSAELKWAGRAVSAARDTEILREGILGELAAFPAEVEADHARAFLAAHFGRAAGEGRAQALEALDSGRYAALLGALERLVSEPPLTRRAGNQARIELSPAIERVNSRLAAAVSKLDAVEEDAERDAALHEVRKKAKQARYAADAAQPAFGGKLKRWRNAVKAVQTTLGDYHDLVETRTFLRELRGMSVADAFAAGMLYERALAHGALLRARFAAQWREIPQPV